MQYISYGRRTLVFWEAFTAVPIIDAFWDFVRRVALVRPVVFGEHIASVFSFPQGDRISQLCTRYKVAEGIYN
jgi:hypothetical protein